MLLKRRAIFGAGLFLMILAGSFIVAHVDGGDTMNHGQMQHANMNMGTARTSTPNAAMTTGMNSMNANPDTMAHSHVLYDVSHFELPPGLSMKIEKDAMSGWNIHLETEHFLWSPEHVNDAPVDGQGHAHLYVNEEKVARLYGNWYHLDGLPQGRYSVKVQLNGNDHSILSMGPNPIEVIGLITQP